MSIDTDQSAADLSAADRSAVAAADPPGPLADPAVVPLAEDLSVGARLVKARTAQGRTVEDLSVQTHLRATVIRNIEADDFRVCGGDCYARGHLRLLGQALGSDADELVEIFDRHQAAIAPFEEAKVDDWSPRVRSPRFASLFALCTALIAAGAALLLAFWL
jgi:cytoskeletal protein RodZ